MTTELRPLGVTCNLACHYCYQNPERDAGNERLSYDLDKMKAAALRSGGPFTLFGGEPLMMRFADLENLFVWGLEQFGGSSIQTNGVLIETRHIDLFRRCKVSVGISIDGPGALNDARWHRGLDRTRRSTARVHEAIARLCREHTPPTLIVTLHKGNATSDKLPEVFAWMRELDAMGIKSVRLHLLEVDHSAVRNTLALSPRENIEALLAFAEFEPSLQFLRFDLFREMERLILGQNQGVSCTWRACDPYTTESVQGVEGNGQTSNCGRTNKDGIGFIKANKAGYERYQALFETPQSENGCKNCRFFLMCKGQCPGTAVDGDWRNRTEHCDIWMRLFECLEQRLIDKGEMPLTMQPLRLEVEQRQLLHGSRGENPLLHWIIANLKRQATTSGHATNEQSTPTPTPRPRISWVGEEARELWELRFARIQFMFEDMTVHGLASDSPKCAIRLVRETSAFRLVRLSASRGLTALVLSPRALPGGVNIPARDDWLAVFVTGNKSVVETAAAAFQSSDWISFFGSIEAPACCGGHASKRAVDATVAQVVWNLVPANQRLTELAENVQTHPLLAPMGLSILPILPCSLNCRAAQHESERWLATATSFGYATEVGWLRDCLSWAAEWSELHGVTAIKTPVFKLVIQTEPNIISRRIKRHGTTHIEGAAAGLRFPFAAPVKAGRDSHLRTPV